MFKMIENNECFRNLPSCNDPNVDWDCVLLDTVDSERGCSILPPGGAILGAPLAPGGGGNAKEPPVETLGRARAPSFFDWNKIIVI